MSFAHLTLPVIDVDKTSQFFQQVMGWQPLQMPGNIDIEAAWLEICPGQQLHLLGIADTQNPGDQEFGRHYAFFYPGEKLDGLAERVKENGGEVVAPIRETPFRRLFFRDPTGYLFELIDQNGYKTET